MQLPYVGGRVESSAPLRDASSAEPSLAPSGMVVTPGDGRSVVFPHLGPERLDDGDGDDALDCDTVVAVTADDDAQQ